MSLHCSWKVTVLSANVLIIAIITPARCTTNIQNVKCAECCKLLGGSKQTAEADSIERLRHLYLPAKLRAGDTTMAECSGNPIVTLDQITTLRIGKRLRNFLDLD